MHAINGTESRLDKLIQQQQIICDEIRALRYAMERLATIFVEDRLRQSQPEAVGEILNHPPVPENLPGSIADHFREPVPPAKRRR